MNAKYHNEINKIYNEAIEAMENGKSVKYIKLALLECAAKLDEYAKMDFNERTKCNARGFRLVEMVRKLTSAEAVADVYFELTGRKLVIKSKGASASKALDDFEQWVTEVEEKKDQKLPDASDGLSDDNGAQQDSGSDNAVQDEQETSTQADGEDRGYGSFANTNNPLRVMTLSEYMGQEQIKPRLKEAILAAKKRGEALEHILMFGSAGLGKTTLAKIIANEMGGNCIVMSGPTVKDAEDFVDVIKNVKKGDVVFIDEIHRISPSAAEAIYTAMEDFELSYLDKQRGRDAKNVTLSLPPFTLIGATTHSGLLSKPMRDRFPLQFKLEPYSESELAALAKVSMSKLGYILDDEGALDIAKRSRGVPRICNRFVKRIRDKAQLTGVSIIGKEITSSCFKQLGVDESGLDDTDTNYLSAILYKFDGGPVGIDTLCSAIGEGRNIVEQQIEPYLIYLGYINVTSAGREITEGGKRYLEGKKAKNALDPSENVFAKDIGENVTENASNIGSEKNPITDDESGENRANEENQIDNDSEDSNGREPASGKEDLSESEEQGDDK